MERIICLAIGYICGLFQTSYLYGKMKGIDIREHGSGNAGTTNTLRVLGLKAGVLVLAGDILKTGFAMTIVRLLFRNSAPEILPLLAMYAGAGAILGHNYPFYLKFKGGKGIASTAGLIIFFHPILVPIEALVFFGIFFTTHYVSLGSLLVYIALIAQLVFLGQNGFLNMTQPHLNELYILVLLLAALAYWKHRSNIGRLLHGNERKTYLTKKNKEEA